jgi:hypothetical protein
LAAWLAIDFGRYQGGSWAPVLAGGALGMGALTYWLVAKGVQSYAVLYLAALFAVVLGVLL